MNQEAIAAAIKGRHRSAAFVARDAARRPLETLAFFGITETMTVAEIWPTTGYWTEILGPLLKPRGKLIVVNFPPDHKDELCRSQSHLIADKIRSAPELYGDAAISYLARGRYDIAPPASCDAILTFLNLHNWLWFPDYFDATMAAFRRSLKPEGILGIVEHRGRPDTPNEANGRSGYVNQDHAVAMIEARGFALQAASEIGANPRDTKDHPKGVWTLPPSLVLRDLDRAKYEAIGELDRMTLKFTARP